MQDTRCKVQSSSDSDVPSQHRIFASPSSLIRECGGVLAVGMLMTIILVCSDTMSLMFGRRSGAGREYNYRTLPKYYKRCLECRPIIMWALGASDGGAALGETKTLRINYANLEIRRLASEMMDFRPVTKFNKSVRVRVGSGETITASCTASLAYSTRGDRG
ncbi:hypothetical protein J6590_063775 [Homalodisca vitripennis]|nr:hypothetical protein J6590_063775 [Homalodisca vitripennis]